MGGKGSGNRGAGAPSGNKRAAKPGRGMKFLVSLRYEEVQEIKEFLALETGHEPSDKEAREWWRGQAKMAVAEVLRRKLEDNEAIIL